MDTVTIKHSFNKVLKKLREYPQMDLSTLGNAGSAEVTELSSVIMETIKNVIPEHHFKRIMDELFSLGPLEPLMENRNITEILINGKDHIFYEQGGRLCSHSDVFLSSLTFNNYVHRVCEESKVIPSLTQPFADGNWRGWRLHIVRSPIVENDFHLSFRKHPKEPWTFSLLEENRWAPAHVVDILKNIIKEKKNILIAGPTSSGKTSVLNACLKELPENERVVTIEDSSELQLPNVFSTKLLTRIENTNALNSIEQTELVKQSLRMRPDRIIMGETRGAEAKDLLMILTAGHKGSMGTIHANNHKQALRRLEMLVQMSAVNWNSNTVQQMIALSIDNIIILDRKDGERKLQGIYKLAGLESTGYLFDTLFCGQLETQPQELISVRHRGGI